MAEALVQDVWDNFVTPVVDNGPVVTASFCVWLGLQLFLDYGFPAAFPALYEQIVKSSKKDNWDNIRTRVMGEFLSPRLAVVRNAHPLLTPPPLASSQAPCTACTRVSLPCTRCSTVTQAYRVICTQRTTSFKLSSSPWQLGGSSGIASTASCTQSGVCCSRCTALSPWASSPAALYVARGPGSRPGMYLLTRPPPRSLRRSHSCTTLLPLSCCTRHPHLSCTFERPC